MIEKYLEICNLLDCLGQFNPNLDTIQKIIQQPDFRYAPYEFPEILTNTLSASSYWLDQELFDERYLYKKENKNLSSLQEAHLKMLDIGVTLLNKGFPLKYDPEHFSEPGVTQLGNYVKTFIEQCHKRKAFLEKIPHKEKRRTNIVFQKTLD